MRVPVTDASVPMTGSRQEKSLHDFIVIVIVFVMDELLGMRDAIFGPFLLHALELAPGAKLRRGAETVRKEDAIEMIDFVLKSARQKTIALHRVRLAVKTEESHGGGG